MNFTEQLPAAITSTRTSAVAKKEPIVLIYLEFQMEVSFDACLFHSSKSGYKVKT